MRFIEGSAIGVCTKKGFLPKIIRWFTGVSYNHWAIVTRNNKNEKCLSEAVEEGIVYSPLDKYNDKKKYKIIERQPAFSCSLEVIQREVKEHLGQPYDVFDLTVEQPIYLKTGFWIGDRSDREWICVKWVMYLYYQASNGKYFQDWYKLSNKSLMSKLLITIKK